MLRLQTFIPNKLNKLNPEKNLQKNQAKILAIFIDKHGGENVVTKSLLQKLKVKDPNLILIEKIANIKVQWVKHNPRRFQLISTLIKLFLKTKFILDSTFQQNIKIVYSPSILVLFICSFLAKYKLIYHYHGESYQNIIERIKESSFFIKIYLFFYNLLLAYFERITIKKVKLILVPSQFSRKQIKKLFPFLKTTIKIVPYGCDRKIFFPKPQSDYEKNKTLVLLYVGRIDPNKGLTELVRALLLIAKNIKVYFIAAFLKSELVEYQNSLIKQIAKLNSKQYKIYWNLKPEKLASLYRRADLSALPSYFEQYPLAFIESISCGTPVLTSKVGNLPEIQQKISKSLLLPNVSVSSITNGVLRYYFLSNKEKWVIQQKCIKVAGSFSWVKSSKKIYQEFLKILN